MFDANSYMPSSGTAATIEIMLREVLEVAPRLGNQTRALLRRITTPNWVLEWCMPRWIGEAFRLDKEVTDKLALANAYMLAYTRGADDLADGEEAPAALRLNVVLQHLWIQCYARVFANRQVAETQAFWAYFQTNLSRWITATLESAAGGGGVADRGATLRIVCGAACVLAGRMDALVALERATDDIMAGVTLLDDYFDWAQDLDAGRQNSFVTFCSELSQTTANRESNRRAVLRQLCLADAASRFLRRIAAHTDSAQIAAHQAGCEGLARFAESYQHECEQCADAARIGAASMISAYLARMTG